MLPMFRVPKHSVFEYKPMYYDPEKERREQRRKELGLATSDETPSGCAPGALLRAGAMRARHESFMQEMESNKRRATVRRLVLVVILSVAAYLVISGNLDFFFRIQQ